MIGEFQSVLCFCSVDPTSTLHAEKEPIDVLLGRVYNVYGEKDKRNVALVVKSEQ